MASRQSHVDHLRLRHLRLLQLVDEHGSLRRVAEMLNLSQPTVSQLLKDLEYALAENLVERSSRGANLTAAGRLALRRARLSLAMFDQLAVELRESPTVVLRLGTNPALMLDLLPRAIGATGADMADVRFEIVSGTVPEMMAALREGKLDCYVGRLDWGSIDPDFADGLAHDVLIRSDLVIACARRHPLAARSSLSVDDLKDCRWVLPRSGSFNRIALETAFRELGQPLPYPAVELSGDLTAVASVAGHCGLLLCAPRFAVHALADTADLAILDVSKIRLPALEICLATLAGQRSDKHLQGLRRALLDCAAVGGSAMAD